MPVRNGYNELFITKGTTDAIKGIFIIIVFINHIGEYYTQCGVDLSAWYDMALFLPSKACGQLMVVMFLFYSGYGVAESIKNKGEKYINIIPKRRVWGTLLNFDVAVVLFAVTSLLLGIQISWNDFFLSLIGWSSVGNSNWYIFVIVVCYALTYCSYKFIHSKCGMTLNLTVVLFAVVMSFLKGTWWYNTVLAYGAGVLFSEHRDFLIDIAKKHYRKCSVYILSGFLICLCIYLIFYGPFKSSWEQIGALVFNVMSVFFAFMILLITLKVKIGNPILIWLGMNLFPIYIYQRLSMMILTELYPNTLVGAHPVGFFALCFLSTVVIAYCYKWFCINLR